MKLTGKPILIPVHTEAQRIGSRFDSTVILIPSAAGMLWPRRLADQGDFIAESAMKNMRNK